MLGMIGSAGSFGISNFIEKSSLNDRPWGPSLNALRQLWKKSLNDLSVNTKNQLQLKGLDQLFNSVFCETSLPIVCEGLMEVARSAGAWQELQPFCLALLQWISEKAPHSQGRQQALQEIRRLEGNPLNVIEGAQFLVQEMAEHPLRPALLVGMGTARLGTGLGRSLGLAWARAKNFNALGQGLVGEVVGFGGEVLAFSGGMRGVHRLQGQKLDGGLNAWLQELWQATALMAPMKLFGRFSKLSMVKNRIGILGVGAFHFSGAMVGSYTSGLAAGSALSFYQTLLSASQLSLEGALAASAIGLAIPRFEAFNRALENKTKSLLAKAWAQSLGRAQQGLRSFRLRAPGLFDPWQWAAPNGSIGKPGSPKDALQAKEFFSFAEGRAGSPPLKLAQSSSASSQSLWDCALEGGEGAENAVRELVERALESRFQSKSKRDAMPSDVKQAIWALFHLAKAEGVPKQVAEIAREAVGKIPLEEDFPGNAPPVRAMVNSLDRADGSRTYPLLRWDVVGFEALIAAAQRDRKRKDAPEEDLSTEEPSRRPVSRVILHESKMKELLGDNAALVKFLAELWEQEHPDQAFPLSQPIDFQNPRGFGLFGKTGSGDIHFRQFRFVSPDPERFYPEILGNGARSKSLPGALFIFFPNPLMPGKLAVTQIKGRGSAQYANAWLIGRFPMLSEHEVAKKIIYLALGLSKAKAFSSTALSKVIAFGERLAENSVLLDDLYLTLQQVSPRPQARRPALLLLTRGTASKGKVKYIGLHTPEELERIEEENPSRKLWILKELPLSKSS